MHSLDEGNIDAVWSQFLQMSRHSRPLGRPRISDVTEALAQQSDGRMLRDPGCVGLTGRRFYSQDGACKLDHRYMPAITSGPDTLLQREFPRGPYLNGTSGGGGCPAEGPFDRARMAVSGAL